MPWAVAAAGIGAAGTIGGSLLQSGAAGKAAGQAQHNLEMVVPQLQQNYNTAVGGFQPYQAGGAASTADMQDLLGLNGQDAANAAMAKFQSSPGYQFQMQQGLRGVDAGAAAQGMLRSGATLKAEDTFAQGLANTDFGQYYNRLSGLAGQGLTAAGGIATAGNNLGAGLEGNASSQATTAIGAGNAQSSIYGNTASGLGNIANNLFSNQNFQNWAGGLFSGTPAPGTSGGYNNGADLVSPVTGQVTLPPVPPELLTMSGTQVSSAPNVLFDPLMAGRQQAQQNTLMQQQQELTDHDVAMTGQAAAPLLNMSEEAAAAAYPGWIQDMQRQGLAKYAPPTYPGHAATQALVQRAIPLVQQYNLGIMVPPGLATALQGNQPSGGNPPAQGGQPPAQGGQPPVATRTGPAINPAQMVSSIGTTLGVPNDDAAAIASNFHAESGLIPGINEIHPVVPGSRGGYGLAQWTGPRRDALEAFAEQNRLNVSDPATQLAFMKQDIAQNYPDLLAHMAAAKTPEDKAAVFFREYESGGAPGLQPLQGTHTAHAAQFAALPAPVATAPPGTAPQDGRYQVASNAPVAPPGSTAQPGQPPAAPAAPVVAQGDQPPAPAPAQPPASTAAASRANLPHASEVPTGQNSPQYQEAQRIQQQIGQLMPYAALPAAKAKIAQLQAQQQLLMQTDNVVQTQEGQLHVLTGALDKTAAPLPHYVYDSSQHAYIDTTGTNKPEFEPAQRDTAVAQRDVMELGPKVANGTATPEEQARYNVAATTYQQPTLKENPVTKETVRVNTRELPPGFPQPGGVGGGASGGAGGSAGSSNVVIPGYSPAQQEIERDPTRAKVADQQYDRDSKEIAAIGDAGRQAQADQVRITQMQDVLQRFSSGAGTEARTAASAWLQRWLPSAITGWEKTSANLSGADAAQEFQKLALTGAGSQERSVLGNRGGFQAIRMFQAANPNVSLQDATNKSILDMQLITNQANQDYSQAALSHFAEQEQRYGDTHKYTSLAQFDRTYNQQRNPQVYAAAMGAVAGQPPEQWAKGLSDAEYARALKVVENAKPGAVVNGKSGRIVVQPPTATPPPGFTVVPQ